MPKPQLRENHATSKANQSEIETNARLIPLTAWPNYHAWPPIGGLRHLVFHAESTGFNKVIRRIGRRVLVDEIAFFDWANNQGSAK